MKILNIIEGAVKSVLNISTTITTERIIKACKECKLSHDDNNNYTGICSLKNGGCGCVVDFKVRVEDEVCPLGIWHGYTIDLDKLEEINNHFNFKKS